MFGAEPLPAVLRSVRNVIFDLYTISIKGCCVVQMVYAAYYQVCVKTKEKKSLRFSTIIVGAF